MTGMYPSISALSSFGVSMQATAHNVANVNTNGFKAQRVQLTTGPVNHEGVRVGRIDHDTSPGPAVVDSISAASPTPETPTQQNQRPQGYLEGSNTDLPREFVNMTTTEVGYKANATVIRSQDEMTGFLLNIIV